MPAATPAYIGGTAVIMAGGGVRFRPRNSQRRRDGRPGHRRGLLSVGGSVGTITVPAVLAFLGDGVNVTAGGVVDARDVYR